MSKDSAPIPPTCVDIDKVISIFSDIESSIDDAILKLDSEDVNHEIYSDLHDAIRELQRLQGKESVFERLRQSNDALRKWGNYLHRENNLLEEKNEKLKDEVISLKNILIEVEKR